MKLTKKTKEVKMRWLRNFLARFDTRPLLVFNGSKKQWCYDYTIAHNQTK